MDAIIALILSCSLHPDDALVRAFVERVSDGNLYFVGDLATVTSHDHVKSLPEALELVDEIEKKGGRPAVGLMAVPVAWAPRYGRSRAELFDGCINIAVATDAMVAFEDQCSRSTSGGHTRSDRKGRHRRLSLAARRLCILQHFDRELGIRGYPEGVLSQLAKMKARREVPATSGRPGGSAVPDPTDGTTLDDESDWSSPLLYFSSPTVPIPRGETRPQAPAPRRTPQQWTGH